MAIRIHSAGQLNQRVQFKRRQSGRNELDELVDAWSDVWTPLWAKVEPLTGREFLAAGAEQSTVDTRFIIRFREGVTEQMRVAWRGAEYDIRSAQPVDGGREWIEVMASRVSA